MALKLTHYYRPPGQLIDHSSVVSHLREVLNSFAAKQGCNQFYVGITGDLDRRRKEHEADSTKKCFTLMCVIHGEPVNIVANSFHNLEKLAIERFGGGVINPATGARLTCANGPGGSTGKNWLYILVDLPNAAEIPLYRPGSVWINE